MKTFLVFLLVAVSAAAEDVVIRDDGGKLRVEIGGELFTEYHYQDVARPYFYPIIGPGGAPMTRDWPMKDTGNDSTDHPHNRGLWYAHGKVNDIDFWSEKTNFGKIVHEKFLETSSGTIRSSNNWVAPDGKVICSDERAIRIHAATDARLLDFEITLLASQGDITLGDTKEGSMAIRVPDSMVVTKTITEGKKKEKKPGNGHIITSEDVRDADAWGKQAVWIDYHGPVNDKTVGVAIFDHPHNPRHPTWWQVRDYGLFAANPFGVHDFEKKPAGTGDMKIEAGKSVTFRYRFVFHEGDEKQGRIAERYQEFAKP